MKDTLRWAYALNQWNLRMDVFVRHEDQQRALKSLSVLGFDHVELAAGTGRWDNLGRPEVIALNHGGPDGLLRFLHRAGVRGVSSMFWDPGAPGEEEGWAFRSTLNPADHDGIVAAAGPFIDLLAGLRTDAPVSLVARPAGSAWMAPPVEDASIDTVAAVWNDVGRRCRQAGVGLALHYDCLGAIHGLDQIERLLEATDPELVGIALDTAEMTIAGIDPLDFYETHHERVTHVHLKDCRDRDTGEEYLTPGAETAMMRGGGGRGIERWFYELGTEGGLVDVPSIVDALRARSFSGWVVVESDKGSDPTELAMLNSWYLQHRLGLSRA